MMRQVRTTTAARTASLVAWRYNRVSDDKNKRSRSIKDQDTEALDVIAENGWVDGGSYEDPDISASRFSTRRRPDWERLLADLAEAPPDILVIWEPSRGSRRLSVWATLLETCQDLGVKIHVVSHHQTYDLKNPRHWRTLAEDGVDSGYEVEKTSMRVRRDLAHAAQSGRPHGRLLYGYRRIYDKDSGVFVKQVINQTQARVVRSVAKAFIGGTGIKPIVEDLNRRKIPPPQGTMWVCPTVGKMLANPAYIGKRVHQGIIIGDGQWPAILDETTFYACQRILSDPARKKAKDNTIKHILSGLATAPCGGMLRVVPNMGRLCYVCSNDGCVSIRKEPIEDYVRDVTCAYLADPDVLARLSIPHHSDDVTAAEAEAESLRAQLRGFYDAAEAEELTALDLAEMTRRLRPKIAAAEARAKRVRVSPLLRRYGGADIAHRWPGLPLTVRRELIREHLEIQVLRVGRGRRNIEVADRVVITPRG